MNGISEQVSAEDWTRLEQDLRRVIAERGTLPSMPSQLELLLSGHRDLAQLIGRCGGPQEVARRMGLDGETRAELERSFGRWDYLMDALKEWVEQHGAMPDPYELMVSRDLRMIIMGRAMIRRGGIEVLERRMRRDQSRPPGHWHSLPRFRAEMESLIAHRGQPGIMPSALDLQRWGRGDMTHAVQIHGGFTAVAHSFNLRTKSELLRESHPAR